MAGRNEKSETDRDSCKERRREAERQREKNREGDVIGGWRECFLKACQWVSNEKLRENDCHVTRSTPTHTYTHLLLHRLTYISCDGKNYPEGPLKLTLNSHSLLILNR